jgi:hypothetical protein
MTKIYVKNTWADEILSGPERYDITDNVGAPINSAVQIALTTPVIQAGTLADAAKMNNIETGLDAVDSRVDANEIIQLALLTGWIAGALTWTYASANTLTIPGNVAALFPVGTKIKLTQTTVKYFYVVGASYSSPNTTLTLAGGSDYSLTNAAITSPHYSYTANPQGHPIWFNYAPAPSASGSMTLADVVVDFAKFCIVGREVRISLRFTCTTGGTASNTINTVVPVTGTTTQAALSSYIADPGSIGSLCFMGTTARTDTRRYDSGNFGLGASRVIAVSGGYVL